MRLRFAILAALVVATPVAAQVVVHDGDTLTVGDTKVRLSGVNCPEWNHKGGPAATASLEGLVAGKRVNCQLTGARNRDRMIGFCSVDGVDLGEQLIVSGVCSRCERYDKEGRYSAAQNAAGPWRGSTPGYCRPR